LKQVKKIKRLKNFSRAKVKIPGSKSYTQRAFLCAALCEDTSVVINPLLSEDTLLLKNALERVGVQIEEKASGFRITGKPFPELEGEVFFGNNGTGSRFFLAYASLGKGEGVKILGVPRLHERPVSPLIKALRSLGAKIECLEKEGHFPVLVKEGNFKKGRVKLPGNVSSQFFSALLLISPVLPGELELYVEGELLSGAYIEMTQEVMEAFGVSVIREGNLIKVPYKPYKATRFEVEADASSASYFLIIPAVLGGGEVMVENYVYPSRQADSKLIEFLKEMGAEVKVIKPRGIMVRFGGRPEAGEFDLKDCPDLFPTMCILGAVSRGRTVLKGAPHLRYKETDRISAMAKELQKVGVKVEELPDGLIIEGTKDFSPATISTYNDHRIAMAFAVLGLRTGGIEIEDPECVQKSFPNFWECLEDLYENG